MKRAMTMCVPIEDAGNADEAVALIRTRYPLRDVSIVKLATNVEVLAYEILLIDMTDTAKWLPEVPPREMMMNRRCWWDDDAMPVKVPRWEEAGAPE